MKKVFISQQKGGQLRVCRYSYDTQSSIINVLLGKPHVENANLFYTFLFYFEEILFILNRSLKEFQDHGESDFFGFLVLAITRNSSFTGKS